MISHDNKNQTTDALQNLIRKTRVKYQPFSMKLNFSFFTLLGFNTDVFVIADCNKNDLKQPKYFKKWECSFTTDTEYVCIVS